MTDKSIGFLGGGRIARILLNGWVRAGTRLPKIVVSDSNQDVLNQVKQITADIRVADDDNAQAAAQEIVFVALHPPVIAEALPQVQSSLRSDAILVSLAPKLTIARLSAMLGGFNRIARMIPNAPTIVRAGFNPIVYSSALTADDRNELARLLDSLGRCPEVAESKLEAFAILTAMGPTYLWPQLYELQALAETFGLDANEAEEGLRHMVAGAVATMFDSGLNPDEVQDLIPVKPLADLEQTIVQTYRTKLTEIMNKIKP